MAIITMRAAVLPSVRPNIIGQSKPRVMPAPNTVRGISTVRKAHAGHGYESDAEVFDPYVHDQLTHSITGEYDMGIFFLIAGGFFMLPVMFPGSVLIVKAIWEAIYGPLDAGF